MALLKKKDGKPKSKNTKMAADSTSVKTKNNILSNDNFKTKADSNRLYTELGKAYNKQNPKVAVKNKSNMFNNVSAFRAGSKEMNKNQNSAETSAKLYPLITKKIKGAKLNSKSEKVVGIRSIPEENRKKALKQFNKKPSVKKTK